MSDFDLKKAFAAIAKRNAENPPAAVEPSGRLDPNSPTERIARAKQQEAAVLEQIEWLQSQPDSAVKIDRIHNAFDRLGELAAEQGDYPRARDLSFTPERRDHYAKIAGAIEADDADHCDCTSDRMVDRNAGREIESPAMMTIDRIVSPTGGILNLDVCRKCGFANAR